MAKPRLHSSHIMQASVALCIYLTIDTVPSIFLLGRSPFAKEKFTKEVYLKREQEHAQLPRPLKSLFLLLVPLLDGTTLRLYKAIGACVIVLTYKGMLVSRATPLNHKERGVWRARLGVCQRRLVTVFAKCAFNYRAPYVMYGFC